MPEFSHYEYLSQMGIKDPAELLQRLQTIRHVVLDMDGTIYKGKTLFPFTKPFLETLKKLSVSWSFLTNNPSKSVSGYIRHLEEMGISATENEIYTSAQATIRYVKHHLPGVKRLFILGTPSMIREFGEAGFEIAADDPGDRPDAVVAGFDLSLDYARLCRAAWWITKKLPYIATNPDKVCPTDQPTILVDCGSICAALREATGRNPDVITGKPDPGMLQGILEKFNLNPGQIAMVGDRLYTDIKMAAGAHALGILVLTGETLLSDLQQSDILPDVIAGNLEVFGQMLITAKNNLLTGKV